MTLNDAINRLAPGNVGIDISLRVKKKANGELSTAYCIVLAGYTSCGTSLESVVNAALRRQTISPDDLEDEESVVAEAAGMETVSV